MNKKRSFQNRLSVRAIALAFVPLPLLTASLLYGQAPQPTATVQFSNGQSIATTDFSEPIGIQSGELINITIQFGADVIGKPVVIEPSDGGSISTGNTLRAVGSDGTVGFGFLAPASLGTKSIAVRTGSRTVLLKFSVANASRH